MPSQNLSRILKKIRKELEMSQEDLARAIGVSFATVNRWENGNAAPSRLARAQLELFIEKMKAKKKLNTSNL